MILLNKFGDVKYKAARYVEGHPLLSNLIYNNISRFKFLFPHEKDYHGIPFFCSSSPDTDFIDIGANIGLSTIGFRRLGFRNPIALFEANPFLSGFLDKLGAKDPGLEIHQVALGNENSEGEIHLAYYKGTCLHTFSSFNRDFILNSLKNSFPDKWKDVEIRSSKVSVRRFDDLKRARPPQFVKIDVEGFEHEILKGMKQTIQQHRPVFLIEYNRANFDAVHEQLKDGYSLHTYDFRANNVRPIVAGDLSKLTDPSDPQCVRNLFFVPL